MSTAIVKLGHMYQGPGYSVPFSRVPKIPVTKATLINRINALIEKYGLELKTQTFLCDADGLNKARAAMKSQYGIYLWWHSITGYFYVGSTQKFFGKDGRLPKYVRITDTINKSIADDLKKNTLPSNTWTLIILEAWPIPTLELIDKKALMGREQFWMLLFPTYNRSLLVGSNDQSPMPEQERLALPDLVKFWAYDILNGIILKETLIPGVRWAITHGFTTVNNMHINITNFDLSVAFETKQPFKDVLFSRIRLTVEEQTSWTLPDKITRGVKNSDGTQTVWVYRHPEVNIDPQNAFVTSWDTVRKCQEAYGISRTHFKRVRNNGLPYKNLMFSNNKLH